MFFFFFDTVNHLDTVETPSTCRVHQPPRSQYCEKLGGGLGTRQRIRRVIKTQTLLRGLDEVGQLLYEVPLLTASGGVAGGHKFSWKVFDLPSLQPTLYSVDTPCNMMYSASVISSSYGHVMGNSLLKLRRVCLL